jgi:anti-sigma-K factor RskA
MNDVENTDDFLAAEYVLGLLDGAAKATVERRIASDSAFARQVASWRERFAEFDNAAEVVSLNERLWTRIESGLGLPLAEPEAAQGWRSRLWENLTVWRAAALAATTASVFLVAALGWALWQVQRTPTMIAVLLDGDKVGAVVHVFADGRVNLLPLTAIPVPAGRALQVWTLPSRERGPVSVGLMHRAQTLALLLSNLPPPKPDQLFEITLEPETGSPTGRPTGPVLYKGTTSLSL